MDSKAVDRHSITDSLAETLNGSNVYGIAPFCLLLTRTSPTETILCEPHSNEPLYRITDTGRRKLSQEQDLIVTRTRPDEEAEVGSLRFGHNNTNIASSATGTSFIINFDEFETFKSKRIRELPPKTTATWSVKYNKPSKDKTIPELITLKLVHTDALKGPSRRSHLRGLADRLHPGGGSSSSNSGSDTGDHTDQKPLCIVKLFDLQPTGRIEIWADSACIHDTKTQRANWTGLDELVLSAYANLETARTDLDLRNKGLKGPIIPASKSASALSVVGAVVTHATNAL